MASDSEDDARNIYNGDYNRITFDEIMQKGDSDALNNYFYKCICSSNTTLANVKYMVEQGVIPRFDNDKVLPSACHTGKLEIVQYLITECGLDINVDQGKALIDAIEASNPSIVKYLLLNDVIVTDEAIEGLLYDYRNLYDESYLVLILQKGYTIERLAELLWKHNDECPESHIDMNPIIYFLAQQGLDISQSITQFYKEKN